MVVKSSIITSLGILVTGIQIAIAILGSGRLDSYVGCLEQSLEQLFNKSFDIPANSTLPVCLFVLCSVYTCVVLCVHLIVLYVHLCCVCILRVLYVHLCCVVCH